MKLPLQGLACRGLIGSKEAVVDGKLYFLPIEAEFAFDTRVSLKLLAGDEGRARRLIQPVLIAPA